MVQGLLRESRFLPSWVLLCVKRIRQNASNNSPDNGNILFTQSMAIQDQTPKRLDFSAFEKATSSLEQSLGVFEDNTFISSLSEPQYKTLRAGLIQNFEFTYELCWKFIKRWLENNLGPIYVDGVSRKELFRLAAESQLISDVSQWMRFHKYRNLSTHTYHEETAKEIAAITAEFFPSAATLLKQLKQRND